VDEETGRPGKTVRLKNEGLAGWDERFNHLGSHFEGGRRIREYCYQEEDTLGAGECPSLSESDDDDESLGLGEFGTQPPPQPGYGGFGTGEGLQRLADAAAKVASPMIGAQEEGLRKVVPVQREKRKLQQTGETWYCVSSLLISLFLLNLSHLILSYPILSLSTHLIPSPSPSTQLTNHSATVSTNAASLNHYQLNSPQVVWTVNTLDVKRVVRRLYSLWMSLLVLLVRRGMGRLRARVRGGRGGLFREGGTKRRREDETCLGCPPNRRS
jgi:hypothetical protein